MATTISEYKCAFCGSIFPVGFRHGDPLKKIVDCPYCLSPQIAKLTKQLKTAEVQHGTEE